MSIVYRRREARQAIRREVEYQRVSLRLTRHPAGTRTLNCHEQTYDSVRIQLVRGFFEARQYLRDILAVQRDQPHELLHPLGYLGFICQLTDGAAV